MPDCDEGSGGSNSHRRDPTSATASTITLRYERIAAEECAIESMLCYVCRAVVDAPWIGPRNHRRAITNLRRVAREIIGVTQVCEPCP